MVTECPNCEASLLPIPLAFSTENLNPSSSFLNDPTVSVDVTVQPTLYSSFSKEGEAETINNRCKQQNYLLTMSSKLLRVFITPPP